MKFLSILIIFSLFQLNSFGQQYLFNLHNKKVNDFVKFEQRIGDKKFKKNGAGFYGPGLATPYVFKRKENIIPELVITCNFYKSDSIIESIRYDWDASYDLLDNVQMTPDKFEKLDKNVKSEDFQKAMIKKYLELEKEINLIFGQGKVDGDLSNISKLRTKEGLKKSNSWNTNDSSQIEMGIYLSNGYSKNGNRTEFPTNQIRLTVYNKTERKASTPKLDKERIKLLDITATNFLTTIKEKDFNKSKTYLSDLIINQVKDEQLNTLNQNINSQKKTVLFRSGAQTDFEGNSFTILYYKYTDEITESPKEVIKFIFDNKDKIVGVQPMKANK